MAFDLETGSVSIPLPQINNDLKVLPASEGEGTTYYKLVVTLYPQSISDAAFTDSFVGQVMFSNAEGMDSENNEWYLPYNEASSGSSSNILKFNFRTDFLGDDTYTMCLWYMQRPESSPAVYDACYNYFKSSSAPEDVTSGYKISNKGITGLSDGSKFGQINFVVKNDSLGILIVGITDTDGGGSPI